jgi:TetR/AcrR family fatty acid metabolism transcriptional regulator
VTPRVDPAERRDEIVQAAMRCFARTGYQATSMDDIVAESGLSKGTLYWHFKNKQALFLATLEAIFADMSGAFEQAIARDAPAIERMRALIDVSAKMVTGDRELGGLLVDFWVQTRHDESLNESMRNLLQPYLDLVTQLVEEGIAGGEFRPVHATAVAGALAGMFDGLWLQAMVGLPVEDYVDTDSLADWMLNGLLPR